MLSRCQSRGSQLLLSGARRCSSQSVQQQSHQLVVQSGKDCMRLALLYGACGTFASYLSMHYDGRVLVFKWSVPSPERFVFHTWCWSLGGTLSWMLFWTRPGSLLRVASARVKHGIAHGVQTTSIALLASWSTIGFWSMYFDVKDWQSAYGEYQAAMMAQMNAGAADGHGHGTERMQMDAQGGGAEGSEESVMPVKPVLTYQVLMRNMYEPASIFFLSNAPIWLLCGGFTGVLAARLLTTPLLLSGLRVSTAAGLVGFAGSQCHRPGDDDLLDDGDDE